MKVFCRQQAGEILANSATQARNFEHDADQIVLQTREAVKRRPDYAPFDLLLGTADDTADELEDAAFLLTLLCSGKPADGVLDALQSLAALLVEAAQEWVKGGGACNSRAGRECRRGRR